MRREQLEQCRKPDRPTRFAFKDDQRPVLERTATGRYTQPSRITLLEE